MTAVLVPTTDVNSEYGLIVKWHAGDRTHVAAGQVIAEVETSKAILDVDAREDGFLLHAAPQGAEVPLTEPIGHIFGDLAALERIVADRGAGSDSAGTPDSGVRASAPARRRAAELGVDLAAVGAGGGLVTVAMVEGAAAEEASSPQQPPVDLPGPLDAPAGVRRVALIGAGLGATQVIDILEQGDEQHAVAIVDDAAERWGAQVAGVPVVGGTDRLIELFEQGAFDAAVIAISTSVPARRRLRELCQISEIPLANAIDPTVRLGSGVRMGSGNVICAFCHFGVHARIGDNNFFSAYNSFEHHNVVGSDCSTGPTCVTSGLVTLGDRVRLGTGIFIEPHVELGDGVQVASGAIIVTSVPAEHAVKTKIMTTSVVPLRPR
jgi:acetyltransferase-like isoleucine patch superfamily enzyme